MGKTFKVVGLDISDGYHTFDDLYKHRNLLFLSLCTFFPPERVTWVADHSPGWDCVFLDTDGGQVSYHLSSSYRHVLSKNWARVDVNPWDGHNSEDVFVRLWALVLNRVD